ncbi:YesL family protein [Gracilibacillus alcaliphilus]|uniref:YesL family protein n=1 Tax=Gracilibacillus alcaliphilus TaxID=1401441 RepID=UPI001957931E|nr:DUF624 domain-containing protein [Gracilibacillus alcaliphilus]MBM7678994.1 putative membrane protein YesL [Gracilibacillus alcaliphilus]
MLSNGPFKLLYLICEWIMILVYINVLWVIFTLLGGVVFGVYPATLATFAVVKKWLKSEDDAAVFTTFFQSYKNNFIRANIVGLVLTLTGVLIAVNFHLVHFENEIIHFFFLMILFMITCFYMMVWLYIFPLMIDYQLSLKNYFSQAILVGIATPFRTMMMVAFLFGTAYIFFLLSTLLVLFGVSSTCLALAYLTDQSLKKIAGKAATSSKAVLLSAKQGAHN